MDKSVSSTNYTKESDLFQHTKGDSQQKLMCTCAGALSVYHWPGGGGHSLLLAKWVQFKQETSLHSATHSSQCSLGPWPVPPALGASSLSLVELGSDSRILPSSAFDVHLNLRSCGWRAKVLGGKIMSQKAACLWGCECGAWREAMFSPALPKSYKGGSHFLFCFSLLSFGVLPPPSPALPSPSLLFIEGRFGEWGFLSTRRFMNISSYKWERQSYRVKRNWIRNPEARVSIFGFATGLLCDSGQLSLSWSLLKHTA